LHQDRTIDEIKEEIKRRTDLASLVGEYVTLKKAGRSFKGLCPFHGEKTPSFHVNPDAGFFHCFGCGKTGDAITFAQEQIGYSFMEALRYLGERCGIEIPDRTLSDNPNVRKEKREARDRYYEVNRVATRFFQKQLNTGALRYLMTERGLTQETIDRYEVGFAPDSWDALVQHIQRHRRDAIRDAETVGLVGQGKKGMYARFKNRIMFPVHNRTGEVIAFSGRDMSNQPDAAKYYNSSDSSLFTKGKVLFGVYQARRTIRDNDRAIVVEGNVDVLTLSQHGLGETVAPMGTALTTEQCALIKRMTNNVVLIYDGDSAGQAATLKAIPHCLSEGLSGHVVTLKADQDPDTLVRTMGVEALENLIDKAPPLFDFVINDALRHFDGTIPSASAVVNKVKPLFAMLPNRMERDLYESKLAQRLQVRETQMKSWLRTSSGKSTEEEFNESKTGQAPALEMQLMGLLLHHPKYLPYWNASGANSPHCITHTGIRRVLDHACNLFEQQNNLTVSDLMDRLINQGLHNAQRAVATVLLENDPYGEDAERAYVELIDSLKRREERRTKETARVRLQQLSAHEQLEELKNLGQTP